MDSNVVAATRDRLKLGKDLPLIIFSTNTILLNEYTDFVIWDDANCLVYSFRANPIFAANQDRPIELMVIGYDDIQALRLQCAPEIFLEIAATFGDKMTQGQKNAALVKFSTGTNEDMTKTMQTTGMNNW